MTNPGDIRIKDYDYDLPPGRIAQFPLEQRDRSRLLVLRDGHITEGIVADLDRYLPGDSLLVFNDTRVIRARLFFRKPTGGHIEIFCLEPMSPSSEIQEAMCQTSGSTWKCLVGHAKRWRSGKLILESGQPDIRQRLTAERIRDCGDGSSEIEFRWEPPECTFAEILETAGLIPLPPYITRQATPVDYDHYQTVYARPEGSVAAPTAGLHFTAQLLEKIASGGILTAHVTLHVGLGTFKPVTAPQIRDHVMHHEKISVTRETIETLAGHPDRPVIAIGTTSARTLESLYWLGVRIIREGSRFEPSISQWEPYYPGAGAGIDTGRSLSALLDYLHRRRLEALSGETRLMIVPGYRFRILSGLMTNFHLPQSTLLLLVAALTGKGWREAYNYALQHGFRFLSYGDSCLFFNPHA